MANVLVDEDLPLSLGVRLRQQGHRCQHIIELGRRRAPDSQVFAWAQESEAVLVTRDMDFGNVLQFPLGSHHGMVVVRFPSRTGSSVIVEAVAEGR